MTGTIVPGPNNYISYTTIASFADIGYFTAVPEPGTFVLISAGVRSNSRAPTDFDTTLV